ncbi:CWF19-like protein 2 isoform X1 [Amblyomma americanum]
MESSPCATKRSKKHKHKSHSVKAKKASQRSRSSSRSSDSSSDEWTDAPPRVSSKQVPHGSVSEASGGVQRDAWMNIEDVIPTISAKEHRAQRRGERSGPAGQREKTLRTIDQPGQHQRELNPYWKEGGTGLPKDEAAPTEPALASSSVGDGGLKWLRRAYQRIREQAAEEGRSMEEVAAERYGSLEKLETLIAEAESRAGVRGERHHERHSSSKRYGRMQKPGSDDESGGQLHYQTKHREHRQSGSDKHSGERGRFQRPLEDDSVQDRHVDRHHYKKEHSSSSSKPSWMKKEFYKESKDKQGAGKLEDKLEKKNSLPSKNQASSEPERSSPSKKFVQMDEADLESRKESATPAKILSDKELNTLGAKLIKAEMLGNTVLYDKLKKEIEEARKARESAGATVCPDGAQRGSREEVVILTKTDSRGFEHPLSEPVEAGGSLRKKAKVATHDRGGERVRYFADDDRHSLKQMFEREKMTTAEDQNAEFARLAGKVRASTSQDYDFDDAAMDKASQYDSSAKQDARDRMRAIQEHKHMSKALEKCKYCLDSHEMKKHLIIAIGIRTYLCLPPHQSLTEGHCLIVPQGHVSSGTLLDEDVWLEVQVFRKGLTKMFEEMGKDTIFMETAVAFRHHPHAVIECLPVPMDVGNLAPMYFKKAILECESEWAQNKKLVDLSKKSLRNSVPRGLPYFSVDFGLQGGFAHVIEDEKHFPVYFGKEVVGGMLDLEPRLWLKQRHENFDEQKKKVLEFAKWWKPYDWTERLKPESS